MKLTHERANAIMDRNGGWLDLRGTQITALPDNLTVGGWLDLSGTPITRAATKKVKKLHDGDYADRRYIYADGILTHVRGCKKVGEYVIYIGKIKGRNVVSDGKMYAHCDKLSDGIQDIAYKRAKDRGAEQYKGLDLNTVMPIDDAVTMYRVITGACRQGSQAFVDGLGDKRKEHYSIREMIDLTKGQFGAEHFRKFFDA